MEVLIRDGGEVIEIVEVDVGKFGNGRVDVSRNGEVDQKERFVEGFPQFGFEQLLMEEGVRSGRCKDADICVGKRVLPISEWNDKPIDFMGKVLCPVLGAACDGHAGHTAAAEGFGDIATGFSRSNNEGTTDGYSPKDAAGKFNRNIAKADLPGTNFGLRTCPFCGLKGFLEKAVKDRANCSGAN